MMNMRILMALGVSAAAVIAAPVRAQETAESFYKGRTVTIIAGSAAGGGIDIYARLVGRHLGKHVPGSPNVIVQNMPGAGSLAAARHLYSVAPKDGSALGVVLSTSLFDPLMTGQSLANYDPRNFNYIGNAHAETSVCVVRRDAPVQNYSELFEKELIVGGTGAGSALVDYPLMERQLLGAKLKLVSGYKGSADVSLAIQRNEVQGVCGLLWSSAKQQFPDIFQKDGAHRVMVQQDAAPLPELQKMGVPLIMEYARTPDQKLALEAFLSRAAVNRPFMMPPGVPEQRVATMRKAFMETMKDPDLVAEANKQKLGVDANTAEEALDLVKKIYATPPHVLDILRKAREAAVQ
jgi:tripartite-type tricarboxylate transporter receptor subunit TctC